MIKILISCLLGIGLSLGLSWIIFQTDFFHGLLQRLFGKKQADNWHDHFNSIIGDRLRELNLGHQRKPRGRLSKEKQTSKGPTNWQEEILSSLNGKPEILSMIKSLYRGDELLIKKLGRESGVSRKEVQSYFREIIAGDRDFSHFNQREFWDHLILRVYLINFRENVKDNPRDRDLGLMGIYLGKCGLSDQQLNGYWKESPKSITLKFKARPAGQLFKVERELAFQFKSLMTLDKKIQQWIDKNQNYENKRSENQKRKEPKGNSYSRILRLNPDKVPDALEIFEIKSVSNQSSLKKQYRKLALKFHPDRADGESKELAHKKFVQLQKAYETLKKKAA